MLQTPDRPSLALVVREGDPVAAIAIAVFTESGPALSTALATIVESRLRTAGFALIDTRPDPDGYRLRALVSGTQQAGAFVNAVRTAMTSALSAQSPEMADAKRRVDALRSRPYDSVLGAQLARCTGDLGWVPGDSALDPTSNAGAAALDAVRAASHTVARSAWSVVGPPAIAQAVRAALENAPAWEKGAAPADAWPQADAVGVHALAARPDAAAILDVALRVADPYAAAVIAERSAGQDNPLRLRVASVPSWKLSRVTATVRPRGACISFRLDRQRHEDHGTIEADAARVAALLAHEVQLELSEVRADGSQASLQVLRAADPREAAALGAWWSLAGRLAGGQERVAIDLGIPPPRLQASESQSGLDAKIGDAQKRFAAAFHKARDAWARHVVESRARVESGQGELWVLAASPCGVLADAQRDAGTTALAAIAAAHSADQTDAVSVEPWITADGVGVLAHAPPRLAEGPHALARRVADAAARAIVTRRLSDRSLNAARSGLLALIEQPASPFGAGFGTLASVLAPANPSWLAPFGLQDSLARAGVDSVSDRWASLADGPVRVAVLSNSDQAQADAAVRAMDRWMVRRLDTPRACPPLAPLAASPLAARDATVRARKSPPHAWLGAAVPQPDAEARHMLDLLAEGLDGADGWLARSLASLPGAQATVRVVGGAKLAAIAIELTTPPQALDDAVRQVRAMLQRIAMGAATGANLTRASQRLAARELQARLDPRRRLADVWSARAERAAPVSIERWNGWLKTALDERNLATVRVLSEDASASD